MRCFLEIKEYPSSWSERIARGRFIAGFSLVELLISTSVALLMLGMLLSIFTGALESFSATTSRTETFADARASLHLLGRELEGAISSSKDATSQPSAEIPSIVTGIKSPSGQTDEALGFLLKLTTAAQPSSSAQSDICSVTYFLAPVSSSVGASQALFRRLLPSDETFVGLTDLSQNLFVNSCDADSPFAEVVAPNVISFKVRLRDKNFQIVESAPSGVLTLPSEAAHVEVVMKVISSRAALNYFDPTFPAAQKEKLTLRETREFTLRHPIR